MAPLESGNDKKWTQKRWIKRNGGQGVKARRDQWGFKSTSKYGIE